MALSFDADAFFKPMTFHGIEFDHCIKAMFYVSGEVVAFILVNSERSAAYVVPVLAVHTPAVLGAYVHYRWDLKSAVLVTSIDLSMVSCENLLIASNILHLIELLGD